MACCNCMVNLWARLRRFFQQPEDQGQPMVEDQCQGTDRGQPVVEDQGQQTDQGQPVAEEQEYQEQQGDQSQPMAEDQGQRTDQGQPEEHGQLVYITAGPHVGEVELKSSDQRSLFEEDSMFQFKRPVQETGDCLRTVCTVDTERRLPLFNYSAHVYYTSSVPNTWKIFFAISRDMDTVIHKIFEGTFVERFQGTGFPLDFIVDRVKLELPDSPTGWSVMCLTPHTIFQSTVDSYRALPGDLVPYCQISVSGVSADVGSMICTRVHLRGAKEPFNYFTMECGPISAGPDTELTDVEQPKASQLLPLEELVDRAQDTKSTDVEQPEASQLLPLEESVDTAQDLSTLKKDIQIPEDECHLLEDRSRLKTKEIERLMRERDAIVAERNKLRTQLTEMNQKEVSTVAMSYHSGMDVIAKTSFEITSQEHTYEWRDYGVRLHIQQDSLPADCAQCRVEMSVCLSGQYALPADCELVSAVYRVHCPVKFSKHVTLDVQHCCTERRALSFVRAEYTQEDLPYVFRRLEGGVFSERSSDGSIKLSQFSIISVVWDYVLSLVGLTGSDSRERGQRDNVASSRQDVLSSYSIRSYSAQVYYSSLGGLKWDVYFVVTWDLPAYVKFVHSNLEDALPHSEVCFSGMKFSIVFNQDEEPSVELAVASDGETRGGWSITPRTWPVIFCKDVDRCQPNQYPNTCVLCVERVDENAAMQKIKLKDTKYFFFIPCWPTSRVEPCFQQQSVGINVDDQQGAEAGDGWEVAAPTMEEIIATIPVEKRNTPISSEIQIADIATGMNNWELISHLLGLLEVDVVRIKSDNPLYEQQKKSALRCWRDRLGRRATYEELMKIFHSRQDIRMVEELGNLLCA